MRANDKKVDGGNKKNQFEAICVNIEKNMVR